MRPGPLIRGWGIALRFLSVCSGIEAASVAWQPLGWKAVAFSEIEPFPCAVLAHHYPDTPNWGDMINYKEWPDANVDLLCGGTPCQSFSVAGLRKGLDDPRGDLMLTFGAIADKYRPRWLVWENVPGVLSSNGGRDFGTFLGMLGQLGYGFAYRVLDAQHFGIPQRRRRVFVVGCLGDWRRAAAVLFERHSLQGHPAPSREPGQGFAADVAPSLTASGWGVERIGETRGQDPVIAQCLTTGTGQRYDPETETILPVAFNSRQDPVSGDVSGALDTCSPQAQAVAVSLRGRDGGATAELGDEVGNCLRASSGGGDKPYVLAPIAQAFAENSRAELSDEAGNCLNPDQPQCWRVYDPEGVSPSLQSGEGRGNAILEPHMAVRRLTPIECERLQGFPDNYTLIPYRGKPAADGPRYKALGNSWAVPVARWIGERIQQVEET